MTLPSGWSTAPLSEVCRVVSGGTPKTSEPSFWGGDIDWITPADLSRDRSQTAPRAARRLTRHGYEACSAQMVPPGSVVFSSRAPIGYVAIADRPLSTNQGCKTAVPPDFLDPRFLYWHLRWSTEDIASRASGTTFKEISGRGFGETRLRWPDMLEQRRIVEVLEGHLSGLDVADTDLVRARRRSRVLELALVSRLLKGAAATKQPLSELLELSIGGVWGSEEGEDERDVDVLRVTELRSRGRLDPATSARRSVTARVLASRELEPGDLLLEKSGGGPKQPVGRVGLVEGLRGPSVCSNFMQLMRPRRSVIEPGYLHLYLNALHESGGTAHMQRASTNIRNIKASEYLQLPVPVPVLDAQRHVLATSRAIAAEVDRLRTALEASRLRSKGLRTALLSAAFTGRLATSVTAEKMQELAHV